MASFDPPTCILKNPPFLSQSTPVLLYVGLGDIRDVRSRVVFLFNVYYVRDLAGCVCPRRAHPKCTEAKVQPVVGGSDPVFRICWFGARSPGSATGNYLGE